MEFTRLFTFLYRNVIIFLVITMEHQSAMKCCIAAMTDSSYSLSVIPYMAKGCALKAIIFEYLQGCILYLLLHLTVRNFPSNCAQDPFAKQNIIFFLLDLNLQTYLRRLRTFRPTLLPDFC